MAEFILSSLAGSIVAGVMLGIFASILLTLFKGRKSKGL